MQKNIIFLGMPGSGKGTISSILERKVGLIQVSTGDIFREEIKNETPLGIDIKKIVESGAYVPDDITNQIVKNKIEKLNKESKNFILDGFPRTVQQAKFLEDINFNNYVVIFLSVSVEEVVKRLSQRFFCNLCKKSYNLSNFKSKKHPYCENDDTKLIQRADDQPDSVKKRLLVYNEQTSPLIDFYRDKKILFEIQSNQNIDDTVNEILDIINN